MPKYWLFKSEPTTYSFDDLIRDGETEWDGVRNFQARNMLRDEIKHGDGVLFYYSSTKPQAIVGTAKVVREGHSDETAWDPKSGHSDPKSTPDDPIWYVVDIAPAERFARPITLEELKTIPGLEQMMVIKRGARLSVQPVTEQEWNVIRDIGKPEPVRR